MLTSTPACAPQSALQHSSRLPQWRCFSVCQIVVAELFLDCGMTDTHSLDLGVVCTAQATCAVNVHTGVLLPQYYLLAVSERL
jgi:hypothetical protein